MIKQLAGDFVLVFGTLVATDYLKGPIRRATLAFRALARRRWLAIALCALLPVAIRLAYLPAYPAPGVGIHDEFSYLLGADTFAHGRLANPVHPMWQHFETYHVMVQPVYASKYQPGQAMLLAFGKVVFGHPWAGVVLSVALMCGLICWMLQGWVPPAWALLGGLIAISTFGVFQYWMNSYWGGALPAIGGCLALGAVPRKKPWIFALGASVLLLTRPYEGGVICAGAGALLLWRERRLLQWLPAAGILAVTLAGLGVYNQTLTGSPTRLPYLIHDAQYAIAPPFLFQPLSPAKEYRHAVMKKFWAGWDVQVFNTMRHDLWFATKGKLEAIWRFFLRDWPLTLPALAVPFLVTSRRAWPPLALGAIFLLALLPMKAVVAHYVAPAVGLGMLLLVLGLHRLHHVMKGGKILKVALAAVAARFVLALIWPPTSSYTGDEWYQKARAGVMQRMQQSPEKDLIIVRYAPDAELHAEWVYNEASIDEAQVVWAREMDEASNRRLKDYFHGRKVWLLEATKREVVLKAME